MWQKVKQADTSLTPGEEVSLTELNQANTNLHFYKEEPGNLLKQKQMFHPQLNGQLLNMETNIQNARSAGVTEVTPSKLQPVLPFNINTAGNTTSPVLTTIKDNLPIKRPARQIDPHMTQHYLRIYNHYITHSPHILPPLPYQPSVSEVIMGKNLLPLTTEMLWGSILLTLTTMSMPSTQPKVKPNDILHVTLTSDDEQSQAHEVLQPAQITAYGGHNHSLGTSTAATQPQLFIPVGQTVRLVLTPSSKQLSSSTVYGESDKIHSYTF